MFEYLFSSKKPQENLHESDIAGFIILDENKKDYSRDEVNYLRNIKQRWKRDENGRLIREKQD